MKIEKVHAVYFSPTGTTKTVITHLVKCITTLLPEVVTEVKDFTLPSGRKKVPDIRIGVGYCRSACLRRPFTESVIELLDHLAE